MQPAPQTITLLLADARLPSGGHAQSSGVEPALLAGMPVADVPAFLRARARTTGLVDAGTAVVARHSALDCLPVAPIERAWAARTPSRAIRDASEDLGRGLLRLAGRFWPDVRSSLAGLDHSPPRPLVLGAIAAHAGMDAESLVRLTVYDDLACAVAALLKLEPGDPADGVAMVLEACSSIEPHVAAVSTITATHQIPAASAPYAEAWAEAHAVTTRRLFRA
ncbi:urease accessory protein UreF [Agromyces kandeliae]|uniref:Urease accessory protein n=1 Tax=Agromyces kandeliae TaxID=2666141 RepID=A0A6L5QXG5_9MICO|nr:urease accessory UreF family protein [Agromyces kandeliae]MRX42486.1 urease accessory protein [Agromyces kandeliae]